MNEQPTVLDVTKLGEGLYRYRLARPEPFFGAVEQVWNVRVQPNVLNQLCANMNNAMKESYLHREAPDSPEYDAAVHNIGTSGQGLYDILFPINDPHIQSLRKKLSEIDTPLLISTGDPQIHWELINNREGSGFLGLKMSIGRRLLTRGVPRSVEERVGKWRCLIVANPNADEDENDLPDAAVEARQFILWLKKNKVGSVDYLEGSEATLAALLERLPANEYDLIYYAGHIVPDTQRGEYAFRLSGGELLGSSSIRNFVRGAPIVFLNGCWGGCFRGLEEAPGCLEGLTDGFLEAGAQVVIGSVFPVSDDGARVFAEKLFESILGGEPVGEAMKSARDFVMNNGSYGTAWAGFVLYGNPCLRVRQGGDDKKKKLDKFLRSIGMSRDDFERACLDVIEQAIEFGRPAGTVGTPHIFAAIVGGEDGSLRGQLKLLGIPPNDLRSACEDAFKQAAEGVDSAAEIDISENTRKIIGSSKDIAEQDGREKIAEIDLLKGFVQTGGGGMGQILIQLGVDLVDLVPPDVWKEGDFSKEAWDVLCCAAAASRELGAQVISSEMLFIGMLCCENSGLTRSLKKLGHYKKLADAFRVAEVVSGWTDEKKEVRGIGASQSVVNIVRLAKTIAELDKRDKVSDEDLLSAFVQHGGGRMGEFLDSCGLPFEMLTSEIILADGELDMSKFTEPARGIIKRGIACARDKSHTMFGRRHLLYAMLSCENGEMVELIKKQGKDPDYLAEKLHVQMPVGNVSDSRIEANTGCMSGSLLKVFLAAEADLKGRPDGFIGEMQLLRALVKDGGGEAGEFLVENGVRWSRLFE